MASVTTNDVFLTGFGSYLPGEPIRNPDLDRYIGAVSERLKPVRDRVLALNGIESRHYALDSNGNITHLNEEMAENACLAALDYAHTDLNSVECIAAGTTMGDLIIPSFAQQLHGRLGSRGLGNVQCIPTTGVCLAGMTALESAALHIMTGKKRNALVAASDRPSATLRSSFFKEEFENRQTLRTDNDGYNYFAAEFLRWMLSDGAGAFFLESRPATDRPSLRLDWIEINSYANEVDPCMYIGANQNRSIGIKDTWLGQSCFSEAEKKGMINLRQDTDLLKEHIGKIGLRELQRIIDLGLVDLSRIDHFMPHMSSYFFAEELLSFINQAGLDLGKEKWFSNLNTKGNTGSAAIFIILDEAIKSGKILPGETVLIMVPESARFSYCYAQFTCV